jgi:hypothetical protein
MDINSEKTSQIFFFFLRSVGVREDHTSLHYPFVHAGTPADYLYAVQSHTLARAHTYTQIQTHTPVMDFLETRSPKMDEEEEEEVYREIRLFRYFFPGFRPT